MVRKRKRQRLNEPKRDAYEDFRPRKADVIIRIMAPEGAGPNWNPYRMGSKARDHLERMKGGITVRDYLAKFTEEEHKVARQWLWNTIRRGYAKTLGD
jgi:hypothetical protein